jgi:prepilin-type N-terminal cleavage/methylation domain-containing protein
MMRTHTQANPNRRGFSLLEMSIVIAILAVLVTFGLEVAANFVNRNAGNITRDRLAAVDAAIVQFFRVYGRLPCPAVITQAPSAAAYGLEDCSIAPWGTDTEYPVQIGGGIDYGAVPFRTLNLPMSFSLDGFNNKISYAVTANLTAAGGSATVFNRFASNGGTAAQNGVAGIEVRSGILEQPCSTTRCQVLANPSTNTGAAYVLFSNGLDARGAYSLRGSAILACVPAPTTSFNMRVDSQNCQQGVDTNTTTVTAIPKNVFYDSRFNPGLNRVSYFDDYIVWRSKAQL